MKAFLSILSKSMSVLGAVAFVATATWGVSAYVHRSTSQDEITKKDVTELKTSVNYLARSSCRQDSILCVVAKKQDETTQNIGIVAKSFANDIKRRGDFDQKTIEILESLSRIYNFDLLYLKKNSQSRHELSLIR